MRRDLAAIICLLSIKIYAPPALVFAQNCAATTPELRNMEVRKVHLVGPNAQRITLDVHVADTSSKRAAGFQYVCPEVADHTAILFLFNHPHIPGFHMNNVHMPLDIAFIDEGGTIRDIQTMTPYVLGKQNQRRLWSPETPVRAALEVKAGLFDQLGVTEDEWSLTLLHSN